MQPVQVDEINSELETKFLKKFFDILDIIYEIRDDFQPIVNKQNMYIYDYVKVIQKTLELIIQEIKPTGNTLEDCMYEDFLNGV